MLYHFLHVRKLAHLHVACSQSIRDDSVRYGGRRSDNRLAHVDDWLAGVVVPLAAAGLAVRTCRERRVCSWGAWFSSRAVAALPTVVHPVKQSVVTGLVSVARFRRPASDDSSSPRLGAIKRHARTISSRNPAMPASSVCRLPCVRCQLRPPSVSP